MSDQAKVICKSVTVQTGGYPVKNEREKVVNGSKRSTLVVFAAAEPSGLAEEGKESLINGEFGMVFFDQGAETRFELEQAYSISIAPIKEKEKKAES